MRMYSVPCSILQSHASLHVTSLRYRPTSLTTTHQACCRYCMCAFLSTVCCRAGDVCVMCACHCIPSTVQPTVKSVAVFRERLQDQYDKTHAPSRLNLKVPVFKFFQPLIYEAKEVIIHHDTVERLQLGDEPVAEYGRVMQAAGGGKLVLLEGPPGSGKTTVSHQLCRDWAVCIHGTEFELVVLVPLCEMRKKEKVELENLLRAGYWNLPDGVVQHIEEVDGKGVLFILDGYDEIESQIEEVPTVIEKLLHRSYLQHSSVIVTSRGIAAKRLFDKHFIEKRFIIQGLREDEIPVFVSYYFGGSKQNVTEVRSLLDKLDADPRLSAACSNTLALSIVCYLHSKRESIPTTMAGLYGRFLTNTLRDFSDRKPERELLKIMQKYKRGTFLKHLPSILHPDSPFRHLGEVAGLALEGILQDKFVFDSSDEMVPQFPEGFDGYGLLDSAVITDDSGLDTKLYRLNFMHLTMQEFMAALLVASWAPEEQAAFWRKHFALQRSETHNEFLPLQLMYTGYSPVVDTDRFLTMFSFYCGLTGLELIGVQDHLLEEVGNVWKPSFQISQTLVSSCSATAESGNEEFACRLLAPLDKKAQVHVGNRLDSTNIAWCLNACKDRFEELVVTSFGNSIHAVADFLSQLNGLTSLSVLDLPYMTCSTEHSESACSEGTYTSVVWYMCW